MLGLQTHAVCQTHSACQDVLKSWEGLTSSARRVEREKAHVWPLHASELLQHLEVLSDSVQAASSVEERHRATVLEWQRVARRD